MSSSLPSPSPPPPRLLISSSRGRREGRDWHSLGCCARAIGGVRQRNLCCLGLQVAVKVTEVSVLVEKQKTSSPTRKRLNYSMKKFFFFFSHNWTISKKTKKQNKTKQKTPTRKKTKQNKTILKKARFCMWIPMPPPGYPSTGKTLPRGWRTKSTGRMLQHE